MKVHFLFIVLLFLSLSIKAQHQKVFGSYSEGLAWVKKNGKYGFQNKQGELVIPCKYDSVFSFTEGLAAVKIDTNWFYINKQDNAVHIGTNRINDSTEVTRIQYWKLARPFYNGRAIVKNFRRDAPYNAIDLYGNWALGDFGADSLDDFVNSFAEVVLNGKHGIIDTLRDYLVPAKYEDVDSFTNGWVKAKQNGHWLLLNPYGHCAKEGDILVRPQRKFNSSFHTLYFPNSSKENWFDNISQFKLASLSKFMERHPNQRMVISSSGNSSYVTVQRSWDYVYAVIEYVVKHSKVKREQFIFHYGTNGPYRIVNVRRAKKGEDGPSNIPPPFPYFSFMLKH